VDYLKYDWCSYTKLVKGMTEEEMKRPYRVMGEALDACGRDIVYSWSQGGLGHVWEWAPELGANCWRTTGDINDNWGNMAGIGFMHGGLAPYAGPGHWNDPDMLVVGETKWGKSHLTPDEQITHMTLWAMIAAPLMVGCDMSKLDEFTLALLTNDEVLDINQDPLGQAGTLRSNTGVWTKIARMAAPDLLANAPKVLGEVWSRPLCDGTLAVALFNIGEDDGEITARWDVLGLTGPQPVRDCWLRQDLGMKKDEVSATIPSHGAMLLKIGNAKECVIP
jgi:alpha-galactosidase